jgi:alpha-N-acetylglucosaminidase
VTASDQQRASESPLDVLSGLAERVLGPAGSDVDWELLPAEGTRRYAFEAAGGRLVVRGSDIVGAALGFHDYLQTVVGRRVCWDTPLPLAVTSLPDAQLAAGTSRANAVYYLNFCTFSYTAAYWDWDRWQREIDWMALHGVTMPLAAVGHEAVLADVYRGFGLGDKEVREFLGGPGYLPFQFMGCLDGWAGPLPAHWLRQREALGARIIARQLEYGMTPVLPAFSGHVPPALARDDTTERSWSGFTTHLLGPRDPRFKAIAQRIVEVQRAKFGTAHLYAADPFIEMTPPSGDPRFLVELATVLVDGLRAGDSEAVWVMQAWTFAYLDYWTDDRIAALLDAVPDDGMLLLDLWGEQSPQWRRFDGFRGKPWVWCALHNFGGRNDLYGNLTTTQQHCEAAFTAASPPIGVGLAMEATEQNPVVYELVLDLARAQVDDIAAWARSFAEQRYGVDTASAAAAWTRLVTTVYKTPSDRLDPDASRGVVTLRPTFGLLDQPTLTAIVDDACWYNPAELFAAWGELLDVASAHPELLAAELGRDLVSIAATAMSRACDRLLLHVVDAWYHSRDELAGASSRFLSALSDFDGLLSIRPELRTATWESAAQSHVESNDDRRLLIDNARRIISVWDTTEKPPLTDYAARFWSGLVGELYRERWRAWLDELGAAANNRRAPDETNLASRINAITNAFIAGTTQRPAPRIGDPVAELQRLRTVYAADRRLAGARLPTPNAGVSNHQDAPS